MKSLLASLAAVLLISLLFGGCTNQPISLNRTLPTKDLLGYWQLNDGSTGYYVSLKRDGTAAAEQLLMNPDTKVWEYGNGSSGDCFFKELKKGGKTYNFISIGSNGEYRTFLYSLKKKKLVLQEISYEFIADKKHTDEDDVQKFSAPGLFSDFVQTHLGNKRLFKEGLTYEKRKKLKDFVRTDKS